MSSHEDNDLAGPSDLATRREIMSMLGLEISDSEERGDKRSSLEVDDGGAATMMTC